MTLLRQDIGVWLFLLPAVAFFVGYQVWPIIRVLWMSFTDYQFLTNEPANWVWFDNYIQALERPADVGEPRGARPCSRSCSCRERSSCRSCWQSSSTGVTNRRLATLYRDRAAHSGRDSRARSSSCCGSGCTTTRPAR